MKQNIINQNVILNLTSGYFIKDLLKVESYIYSRFQSNHLQGEKILDIPDYNTILSLFFNNNTFFYDGTGNKKIITNGLFIVLFYVMVLKILFNYYKNGEIINKNSFLHRKDFFNFLEKDIFFIELKEEENKNYSFSKVNINDGHNDIVINRLIDFLDIFLGLSLSNNETKIQNEEEVRIFIKSIKKYFFGERWKNIIQKSNLDQKKIYISHLDIKDIDNTSLTHNKILEIYDKNLDINNKIFINTISKFKYDDCNL